MVGFSPKSEQLRIFVASFIMARAWMAREELVGRSSISMGCVSEKAQSDKSIAPNCGFLRCSWVSIEVYREDRLRTGTVGCNRSKNTSIQGIMLASLMVDGHNASDSRLSECMEPTFGEGEYGML
jgi:hypothetical protein